MSFLHLSHPYPVAGHQRVLMEDWAAYLERLKLSSYTTTEP